MKKKISLIYFFTLGNVFGQNNLLQELPQVKSPDTYAFEKYGNVPINMYTGTIDLKIPIYNIETKSGKIIDATIVYDSSGFIPHKKNNNTGYNWTLIAGGKITRKINYIPDEYKGQPKSLGTNPFDSGKDLHGFIHGVRIQPFDNYSVYNLYSGAGNNNDMHYWLGDVSNGYEGEPDEFSFNILDLNGSFMIGNDGKVKVQSSDPNIHVDLSGITTFSHNQYKCIPPKQEIKIIDGEGNIYIFGGDFSKYEISYSRNNPYGGSKLGFKGYPIINAYSISKIIFAKTKEEINFNYVENSEYSDINSFCDVMIYPQEKFISDNPILFEIGSYTSTGSRMNDIKNCPGAISCHIHQSSLTDGGDSYTLLKKSVLSSISYGHTFLKINYKDLGYDIPYHGINNRLITNETVIDNIELYHNNEKIKSTSFLYSDFGGANKRTFLTGIKKDGKNNEYKLEYSNTNSLPSYYTKGIDHWGFWNGKDGNTTLNPIDTYNLVTGDYTLNNTFRDTDPNKYNIALLNKITYPTKGYTIFEYEVPNYSRRMERNSESKFLPTIVNAKGIIGGARLAKKTDYLENNTITKTIRYKYTTSLNGTESSGILMNWPRYIYYFEFNYTGFSQKLMIATSSNVQKNTMDSYNIGYSRVFEIEDGNGYSQYDFYTTLDTPDILQPDAENLRNYNSNSGEIIPLNLYKNYRNLYGIDRSIIRGKLKNKIVYDNSSTKKYEENIAYTDVIDFIASTSKDNNNYIAINHLSGIWVQGYRKFFNPNFTKTKIIKEFNNTMNTQIEYNYSPSHFNLQNKTTTNSKGESLTTEYQYPSDLTGGYIQNAEMLKLVKANRVSEPVIVNKKVGNTNVSEIRNQYNEFNGILRKSAIYQKKGKDIGLGGTYDRIIKYEAYDEKGNITQYTPENGLPVSIIWGYNKQYPIAKIEGATLSDILSFIPDLENASNNNSLTVHSFSNLRERLPNTMITTYTYKPLVGVTSITQPNGQTEHYKYDEANRLEEIKNDRGEVLKTFDYHYKN